MTGYPFGAAKNKIEYLSSSEIRIINPNLGRGSKSNRNIPIFTSLMDTVRANTSLLRGGRMERSRSVLADGNYGDFNFVQIRSWNTSFNAYIFQYRGFKILILLEKRMIWALCSVKCTEPKEIRAKTATKTVRVLASRSISDTCRFHNLAGDFFYPWDIIRSFDTADER